jgi:hypothetical protein
MYLFDYFEYIQGCIQEFFQGGIAVLGGKTNTDNVQPVPSSGHLNLLRGRGD